MGLLGVSMSLSGCRDSRLKTASGLLELTPAELNFPATFVGTPSTVTAQLVNGGQAELPLSWDAPKLPFEAEGLPEVAPAGSVQWRVGFRPSAPGIFHGEVRLHGPGGFEQVVSLTAEALPIPACPTPVACHSTHFDVILGHCVETPEPEGSACDTHNACILGGHCRLGLCIGPEKSCDDSDACTVDVCDAIQGCQHLPAPPCPGDGRCQRGVCDKVKGCGLEAAADGTLCGPTRTCVKADVCIEGACVERDPPDGFVCAKASPCQAEGRCSGAVCARPPPQALMPSWSFDSQAVLPDPLELHDLVMEPDGAVSLMGFFEIPLLRANTSQMKTASTPARRCILWNARLVCADYPFVGTGKVSSIDTATGNLEWTYDFPSSRPDFAALADPGRIFMARLASLGSDRLAAVFEGFPAGSSTGSQCRLYFLVVLDALGNMVSAQQLTDPALDLCNHPHPYGIAASSNGDLYIAFSPSLSGQAPLVPVFPTLLTGFSRDGLLRWKRTEAFVGGELAVAKGVLYPENSAVAYLASTGSAFTFSVPPPSGALGRVVVTSDRVIVAPRVGDSSVLAYDRATGVPSWASSLPPGETLISTQLRLASWKHSPSEPAESVALMFSRRQGLPTLTALNARFGNEEWSCPLGHTARTDPQLFEVVEGSMALMEGSDQCGTCDPPFAQSHAAFHTFSLTGVGIAREPWVGTFGGASHDHQEEQQVGLPPVPPQ